MLPIVTLHLKCTRALTFEKSCLASRIDERIRELDLQLRLHTQSGEIAAFVQVLCLSVFFGGGMSYTHARPQRERDLLLQLL